MEQPRLSHRSSILQEIAMATRKVLILGATGKQGSAVIDGLLSLPRASPSLELLALTRNPASAKLKSLSEAAKPKGISLVPVEG